MQLVLLSLFLTCLGTRRWPDVSALAASCGVTSLVVGLVVRFALPPYWAWERPMAFGGMAGLAAARSFGLALVAVGSGILERRRPRSR